MADFVKPNDWSPYSQGSTLLDYYFWNCKRASLQEMIFLKLGFPPRKAELPLQDMELHEKKKEKDEKYIEKLVRKNVKKNVTVSSRLKAI